MKTETPSNYEIKLAYLDNLELFEYTKAGEEEAIQYTADRLGITYRRVTRAVWA